MPYRVEAGSTVLLVDKDYSCKEVTFQRPVDFELKEVIASPLEEHQDDGISSSRFDSYPWGFNVIEKWDAGAMANEVVELYAEHVFQITILEDDDTRLVNIQGSKNNIYTVKIVDGKAVHCSCRGFRFTRSVQGCKHMKKWTQEN